MKAEHLTQQQTMKKGKIKNILFPTDFSHHAFSAFNLALQIADQLEANIHLYHAYHYAATGEFYIVPELIQQIHTELKDQALEEFQAYEAKAREVCKNPLNLAFRTDSDFAVEGILRSAEEVGADMIIMGTEGAENFMEKWLGSVSSQVISRTDTPVMVIPKDFKIKKLEKMVYATNFEEPELQFPEEVIELKEELGSSLTCVHIRPLSEQREDSYQNQLEQMKKLTEAHDIPYQIIHGVKPWEGIRSYVKEKEVDVLVMFTHHHNLLEKVVNPSMTRRAVLSLNIPMIVLHA